MSNHLTAEQQRKIEENRRKALERRAQRLAASAVQVVGSFSSSSEPLEWKLNPLNLHSITRETSSSAAASKLFSPPFKQDSIGLKTNFNQVSQSQGSGQVRPSTSRETQRAFPKKKKTPSFCLLNFFPSDKKSTCWRSSFIK